MKARNSFFLVLVLLSSISIYSQESRGGEPILRDFFTRDFGYRTIFDNQYIQKGNETYELKSIRSTIDKISLQNLDNANLINDARQKENEENNGISIYGKIINKEVQISDVGKRFRYGDRYFNIIEVSSDTAESLQAYFKDFNMTNGATLYIYDALGIMTLGAFTSDNNPKIQITDGFSFMTQPIIGNKIFIELSYPADSNEIPVLNLSSVVHGFKDFRGGTYGTSESCNVNVACNFNGVNDLSKNIKSVGLILANYKGGTNYTYTCSGALINNGKQDGTPYFLTASHCVGAANLSNTNWRNELLVLFNYEAKTCASNGSDAPSSTSTNSVLGCELLMESSKLNKDFALLKLNTTPQKLSEYRVCYAGWDNSPSSYLSTVFDNYGVHHPKGDAKKISSAFKITPLRKTSVFYGYENDLYGDFLGVKFKWKKGIIEGGSSGSPLFNSFDRLIGTLSTGSDDLKCDNVCTARDEDNNIVFIYCGEAQYSRFSNNFTEMLYWLDPQLKSIQSIGPYCPNSSINIAYNPGAYNAPYTPSQVNGVSELPADVNRFPIDHVAQSFGKKILTNYPTKSFASSGGPLISENSKLITVHSVLSTGEFETTTTKLRGIYKIEDCNKLKYIDDNVIIQPKNPLAIIANGLYFIDANVIVLEDDKVVIFVQHTEILNSRATRQNGEVQTYKLINDKWIFESWVKLYENYTEMSSGKKYYDFIDFSDGHLIAINMNAKFVESYFLNNGTWSSMYKQIFPFPFFADLKNNKLFITERTMYSNTTFTDYAKNKMYVYEFQNNSPVFQNKVNFDNLFETYSGTNQFLYKIKSITKNKNKIDSYFFSYAKIGTIDKTGIIEIDFSNNNIVPFVLPEDDFNNVWSDVKVFNDKIIQLNRGVVNLFKKDVATNKWYKDKSTFLVGSSHFSDNSFNEKFHLQWLDSVRMHANSNLYRSVYNLREIEYLFHPATYYNNSSLQTSAYVMMRDLASRDFYRSKDGTGREYYSNEIGLNENVYYFRYNGYNYSSLDNKTIILSDYIYKIEGKKDISVYATYSVVMKPGFEISAGTNFRAVAQKNISEANIPTCSFTFDDMLNPQLGDYNSPNQMYNKQNVDGSPVYGEIIYKPKEEVKIDNLKDQYKIYPNPTSDIIHVESSQDINTVKVMSIDGKEILKKQYSKIKKVELDLSRYPSGLYIVNVYSEKGEILISEKIIKK